MTDLLKQIEEFLSETKMPPAKFGRDAMSDPNFVFELRAGRDYRRTTAEKVMNYMLANRKDPVVPESVVPVQAEDAA